MANLFFDLDGTLVDSRERLYRLFCDLATDNNMTFDAYWSLKRAMKDHRWILSHKAQYTEQQIDTFEREWLEKIEQEKYIGLDRLFPFTLPTLTELKRKGHNLYVVTARQSRQMAEKQLIDLGLLPFLTDFLVTQGGHSKAELIQHEVAEVSKLDFFVGDTGMDILAGRELGIHTVAVLSGFRDRANLEKYTPDYILEDIGQLTTIL